MNISKDTIPSQEVASTAEETNKPLYSKAYLRYVLFILLLMNTLAFLDRSIINVLSQPIKEDLRLSDAEVGVLGGLAFMLVYTFAALPLARLAERKNRTNLIAACVTFWSLATAAGGAATNFLQLVLSRVAVGAAESGATPTAHSVIGDYFPPERRGSAISLFVLGLPLGIMLGSIIGGYVAEHYSWRVALLVVGIPGVIVALLVKFTVKEPVRGGADHANAMTGDTPPLTAVLKHLLKRSSFLHIVTGFMVSSFALGGVYVFLPALLIRRFDFSVGTSGLIYGMLGGGCAAIGVLIGGYMNDLLVKRDRRWFAWFPALILAVAIPLMILGLLQHDWKWMISLLVVPFALKSAFLPSTLASFHNMVEPRMRATTITIAFMLSNVVGAGGGPYFAGLLSDSFARGTFFGSYNSICGSYDITHNICSSADAYGVTVGVSFASLLGIWAALHYWLGARHIVRDFVT